MRDIKFRIYDKDRKAMYHLLENKLSFGRFEGDRAVDWEDVFADKHEELEIMQYTGLHDKKRKEIYERRYSKIWQCARQNNIFRRLFCSIRL